MLSPPYLNFISPVYLTGYTFFSGGGAIGNPPINILNLPTGDKNLKVLSINNGDLHAPNIHLKDATKGLTQIQTGGGMAPFIVLPREDALFSTGMHAKKSKNTTVCNSLGALEGVARTNIMRVPHCQIITEEVKYYACTGSSNRRAGTGVRGHHYAL